ncbi:cation:proton antiporter [Actinokineospora sp. NPDC004072]
MTARASLPGAHRPARPPWARPGRRLGLGAALVAAPAALAVVALGLGPDGHGSVAAPAPSALDPYPRLLLALPVILAACFLTGALFRRIGQPAVIGEIVAGVLLGPSLLGAVWPAAFAWLFPAPVVGTINAIAQLGLVFFMFLVGAEFTPGALRGRGFTATMVVQVNLAVPILTGVLLAFWLYPDHGGGVGFVGFALFLGVAMSATAFPVLARVLSERGIADSPLGALALACAAVGDVVVWCLLALVVAVSGGGTPGGVLWTAALTAAFAAALLALRPALARLFAAVSEAAVLPILLGGLMLCALATDRIGVHPIFGAFLFGVVVPRVPATARAAAKMESITVTLLLPLFFVHTGLQTTFGLLGSAALWGVCAAVTAVAVVAKWGGTTATARLTGLGWRESLSLGALMNCRGLTELVVLTIGLKMGVISPTVFAMLVIMTLVSTIATAPALTAIDRFPARIRGRTR